MPTMPGPTSLITWPAPTWVPIGAGWRGRRGRSRRSCSRRAGCRSGAPAPMGRSRRCRAERSCPSRPRARACRRARRCRLPDRGDQVPGGEAAPFGIGKVKPPPLETWPEPDGCAARAARARRRSTGGLELARGGCRLRGLGALESCRWSPATSPRALASWLALALALLGATTICCWTRLTRTPREALRWRSTCVASAAGADLERAEAGRLGGDGAAGGADTGRRPGRPACGSAARRRDPLEQVRNPRGVEHDADDVGAVGLVVADELLGEHALGVRFERLELREPRARGVSSPAQLEQLGALGVEVGLDPVEPTGQGGDARAELPDPARGGLHITREAGDVAPAGADLLLELSDVGGPGGRGAQLQLQPGGADGHQRHQHGAHGMGEWPPSIQHRVLRLPWDRRGTRVSAPVAFRRRAR